MIQRDVASLLDGLLLRNIHIALASFALCPCASFERTMHDRKTPSCGLMYGTLSRENSYP